MRQLFYYKMRQNFVTKYVRFFTAKNDRFITNCDDVITKCDSYYKMELSLQNASKQRCPDFEFFYFGEYEKLFQNPVKHLRWSILRK